ncbi:Glycosyl transferase, family 20, partial [Cynara cardunculus var. scolymus]
MVSKSYSNLLNLVSGEHPSPSFIQTPRIMTVSDDESVSSSSSSSSSIQHDRLIIVANQLPIRGHRKASGGWSFSLDENSLLLQLKDGLGDDDEMDVIYVGGLKEEIHPNEQDEVSQTLLESFKCVPTFFPPGLYTRFYHGFCKQHLWPLFHYMLPLTPDLGGRFNRSLWQAYVSVNKIFADRIMEVINPEQDFVWIHDYHLMVLPTFLRKRFNRVKLGFFLHSPFPSSEIYNTLPIREELLRALLNSDLIGFHTFDYARHFLSCCSRMLGLSYESKRGYISLEYYGRTVSIKILPVGIHMKRLESVLNQPETESKVSKLIKQFQDQGKRMLLGVDDMDIFKGISLKLLAMEQLLIQHPEWQGKIVLVQIANPARGTGNDVKEVKAETYSTVKRINETFGKPGYEPVILIDEPLKFYERVAYYVVAECCLVTAVRDGMNLMPYEYIISRQGNGKLDKVLGFEPSMLKKSMLVVSEFIGCSPSLSGAIRVNPWNIDSVADAMDCALELSEPEKQMRHEKHYRYVSTHDVGYWARSFLQDLERTCKDHVTKRCWGIGFGLSFRVVALDPNFRKLLMEHIVSAYKGTTTRAILLDYDGTLMPQSSIDKSPSSKTIEMINTLCRDKNNMNVHPVMTLYTETTDGSTIEMKDRSMVWCYEDADPDFGSCQAKELLDHLESVLANEPVTVKRGQSSVEVKPQRGMTPDFVLCIGDDRSDEDMFEVITSSVASGKCIAPNAEVFACTVGNKPSKATYYLDDTVEIARLMQGLASVSEQS